MSLAVPPLRRTRCASKLASLLLLAVACQREDPAAAQRRSESGLVERQISGLQELIAAANAGALMKPGQIFIGVEEQAIQQLLNAALPQEVVLADRFRVRLDRAQATFRASQSVIILHGRARPKDSADTYVDIRISGGLDRLEIGEEKGTLIGHVVADRFDVERVQAGGVDRPEIQALIEELGRTRIDAISDAIPPLQIPVRLEREIKVGGLGDGPVEVAPGKLLLKLNVARVVPFSGRLWVLLDVDIERWQPLAAGAGK